MKYTSTFILVMSSFITSNAQDIKQPATLRVVGQGQISVMPNIGVLNIQIFNSNKDFDLAISGLNTKLQEISLQLNALGFNKDMIKTVDYKVNLEPEYRIGLSYDTVYIAYQNIELEFKNNSETIKRFINTFSKSKTDFKLVFYFKLSDSLRLITQNEIIKLAIIDSKEKAKLISNSASIQLKRIKDIDYNGYVGMHEYLQGSIQGNEYIRGSRASDGSIVGFSPKELLFNDTVTITWEIE